MDPVEPSLHVSLNDLVDEQSFDEVLESLYDLFKIPVRVFDLDGNLLSGHSEPNNACNFLNGDEKLRSACTVIRSTVKAAPPADSPGQMDYVDCFSGMKYALVPLHFQGDAVGKMVIGPYLPAETVKIPGKLFQLAPAIDRAVLRDQLAEAPRLSIDRVRRFAGTIGSILDAVFYGAHKSHVTNQMHLATVRESYREITEKNRRLEELNEERKEFDRRKSNFLAMVSHELRTPLTSIIGYSDMLTEGIAGELAEEQRQFVHTIKAKGDELLKLISSILDFSQIDSGHLTLHLAPVNIRDLVTQAVKKSEDNAARRGINLSVELETDLPTVQLDPEKILTAIVHLIDNAVKFSSFDGLVKVSARVVRSTEEDGDEDGIGFVLMAAPDMLEICVQDYGVGIPDGEQDGIFAPFTQADDSSTREHGGAGLGLAIVKQYVETHGGRVTVTSNLDEGSIFFIRIPMTAQTVGF